MLNPGSSITIPFIARLTLRIAIFCWIVSPAQASVSCDPHFTFLGFSQKGDKGYWEKITGGDCDPEQALYEYHFKQKKLQRIAEINLLENNDTSSSLYQKTKTAITRRVNRPKNRVLEVHDTSQIPLFNSSEPFHFKLDQRLCSFNQPDLAVLKDKQLYFGRIKQAFYNKHYPSWLLIIEHCSIADTAGGEEKSCGKIEALFIYANHCSTLR